MFTASLTVENNLEISPSPRSLFINELASKGSKSSKCSPRPMKIIGLSVAATADKAPPPLFVSPPSSFVMMTLPTLTVFLKARA
jgi:hypothetical protein